MNGKSVDTTRSENLTLKEAADAVARYKADFLSSTLDSSDASFYPSRFFPFESRESTIAGSSVHQIDCDITDEELDKENCANLNSEPCFSAPKPRAAQNEFAQGELKKPDSDDVAIFAVPRLLRKKPFQKSSSFSNLGQTQSKRSLDRSESETGINPGNLEFRISPGTKASSKKMENKLALLRARDAARKEALLALKRERSTSGQRIDLEATAKQFLSSQQLDGCTSTPSILDEAEAQKLSQLSENGGFGDATYTVQSIPRISVLRKSAIHQIPSDTATTIFPEQQESALKAWINFLIRQRYGSGSLRELFEKERVVADGFLRDALHGQLPEKSNLENKTADLAKACKAEKALVADVVRKMHRLLADVDVPSQISAMVEKGCFEIRREVHLFSDVGLQMRLLKVFFSFNIFWLRCGLEAVFNVSFIGPSHLLHRKLAAFIIKRFFKEPIILSNTKCAKGRNRSLITELGREKLGRNFQSKFYQFLFLVDWTKFESVYRFQTPILFLKNSRFKSVEDVIDAVQKEILSGGVIATKLLSRIGFKATYNQGFLDEYRYFVNELSTDLSDGVILSRLVEIVCGLEPYSVASGLRNPSGDRLRKLGNIKRVLEAAKSNGLDLGAIKPENLVQGKTEDIMEVIWRLIGSYVAVSEKFLNATASGDYDLERLWRAASIIQRAYRAYRKKKLFVVTPELERYTEVGSERFAQAQPVMKEGKRLEKKPESLDPENGEKNVVNTNYELPRISSLSGKAALVIQNAYRSYRARKRSTGENIGLLKIGHRSERGSKKKELAHLRKAQKEVRLQQRKVIRELKELFRKKRATVVIQKYWRGFLARQKYRSMKQSRMLQVSLGSGETQQLLQVDTAKYQQSLEEREKAAVFIQRSWRVFKARQFLRENRKKALCWRHRAAYIIQCSWRRYKAKQTFNDLKRERAACVIQRAWQRYKATQIAKDLRQEKAACIIQKHIRGFLARSKLAECRKILAKKMEEFRLKDEADSVERSRPALARVIDALHNLVSNDLRRRDYAALTLGRITAISDECGLYVYKQRGLLFLLDALDSSNRGVHESRVVVHLLLCVYNILKIKRVQNDIANDEQLVQDLVKSCFHYFSAFHKVYDAALNSTKCLLFIVGVNPSATKFKGARYYVNEAVRRFKALSENDELATNVFKLRDAYLN